MLQACDAALRSARQQPVIRGARRHGLRAILSPRALSDLRRTKATIASSSICNAAAASFPNARQTDGRGRQRDVRIWCSNDYLGMGQHPSVIWRQCTMRWTAAAQVRAERATYPAPPMITCCLEARTGRSAPARKPRCCSPRAMSPTGRRWGRWRQADPRSDRVFGRAEPCLDDRRHPPFGGRKR